MPKTRLTLREALGKHNLEAFRQFVELINEKFDKNHNLEFLLEQNTRNALRKMMHKLEVKGIWNEHHILDDDVVDGVYDKHCETLKEIIGDEAVAKRIKFAYGIPVDHISKEVVSELAVTKTGTYI